MSADLEAAAATAVANTTLNDKFQYEEPVRPQLTVSIHDVDMKRLREHLNAVPGLSAEQMIYAISMALVDARFACALDAIIEAKEPGALLTYVASAHRSAIGETVESSPRTMREAVRRMNAYAIKSVEKLIQPEAIEKKVEGWLHTAMKKYVFLVVGLKDDYGRLELIEGNNSGAPPLLAKLVIERCRVAVDAAWAPLVDKAIAELNSEWDKILADALKSVKRSFNHKLTREMEKRLSAEADNRLTVLLTRALDDDAGEGEL
jgi:hypothetical protein